MNKKIENAWEWVKDHKVEIACSVAMVAGGIVLFKASKYSRNVMKALEQTKPMPNPEKFIPDIGIGTVSDYAKYHEGTVTELWMDNIPLEKLGDLGAEFRAKIPDLPDNAVVWALLNIRPDEVNEG